MVKLQECQCWLYTLCFVFWCQSIWHLPGTQFSERQVLSDNSVQQEVGNLQEMTAELHNLFLHNFQKVVRNDGWTLTAFLIMHMLSTCCKLSPPVMNQLLAHAARPVDLAQLTMNFDQRYALCVHKLYHRPHFTVGGSLNKSLHLQPLQWCYCENLGSLASACVMLHRYSIMYKWETYFVDTPHSGSTSSTGSSISIISNTLS